MLSAILNQTLDVTADASARAARYRDMTPAEIEALDDVEFFEAMKVRAWLYRAASRAFYADQQKQMAAEATTRRRIITDDDLHLSGDYDQIDSRRRYEMGE